MIDEITFHGCTNIEINWLNGMCVGDLEISFRDTKNKGRSVRIESAKSTFLNVGRTGFETPQCGDLDMPKHPETIHAKDVSEILLERKSYNDSRWLQIVFRDPNDNEVELTLFMPAKS